MHSTISFLVYTFLISVISNSVSSVRAETVFEAIKSHPNLTKFVEYLEKDAIAKIMVTDRTATVFAPTNQAFDKVSANLLDANSLGAYHIVGAIVHKDKFPTVFSSTKQIAAPLIFSYRDPHPEAPGLLPHAPHSHPPIGQREYFVNNAKIISEKSGYRATQGQDQLLYIIDEVMIPYIPQNAGIAPTANEFLQRKISYGVEGTNPSDYFSDRVKYFELEGLFDRPGNNTFFLPLITSSDSYAIRNIDAEVVRAHVIPNRALFFRTLEGNTEYRTASWSDKIQVGVSLPISPEIAANLSSRAASRIQSRTHKSIYNHHIGIVRTSIVKPNIPVRNGVVHFIEKPFMMVDISVWDFIEQNREGQLSRFIELLSKSNRQYIVRDSGRTLTIFAPNNAAFEKVGEAKLAAILNDTDKLNELIALHIVEGYKVSTQTVKSGQYTELQSSDGKRNVYFGVAQPTESTEVLTVEGGGVNSTCVQADIGANNGVIHIVDKILGIPYQTVYEKVKDDFDLHTTYMVGSWRNDWWNKDMSSKSTRKFTYFAPSKAAWNKLKIEMPSEHKQLTEGLLPVHGEQVSFLFLSFILPFLLRRRR
jgi:uncharacterized surface protein with fasciclin (FAS1) repeats